MKGNSRPPSLYLLSPANVNGKRAAMLRRPQATFELAVRLRSNGALLGEVFSFMSGLYFRGKLTYAKKFASHPAAPENVFVITSSQGLVSPDRLITLDDLDALASVPIDSEDPRYAELLKKDALRLANAIGSQAQVVLLGSIATSKYLAPLVEVLGDRLVFPLDFIGRGDLSRGGLLLRAAATGQELTYSPLGPATRHGPRPSRLTPLV